MGNAIDRVPWLRCGNVPRIQYHDTIELRITLLKLWTRLPFLVLVANAKIVCMVQTKLAGFEIFKMNTELNQTETAFEGL